MKVRYQLTLLLLLSIQMLWGQNQRTIRGKIYDAETEQPIAFAHVGIPEKGIGTTSAEDGLFILKIPNQYLESTLLVSFMGYQTFRKPINDIKGPVRIYLKRSANELVEVVVMGEAAVEDIIRKAVKNIPKNYPTHPTTVLGFYRESRTDDSLNYTYLAEGVLKVYKNSYKSKKEGMVSLVQGRLMNLRDPLDTTMYSGFSSGHMAGHRFDFVKNREDFIDERYFPVYKYWIESVTTYNDKPVWVIRFEEDKEGTATYIQENNDGGLLMRLLRGRKKTRARGRMEGRVFIQQDSYAFVKAEFAITPEGLKKRDDYPLYAGNWRANSYVVNYRQLGDKWYFSDATREGRYGRGGNYVNEIKITEINPEKSKPLPYKERLHRGQQFTTMTGSYDPNFWANYNITPMNESLSASVLQMESQRKAQEVFDAEYMAALQQRRDSLAKADLVEKLEMREGFDLESTNEADLDLAIQALQREQIRRRVKRGYKLFKGSIGLGTHLIHSTPGNMGISYLAEDGETILSVENDVNERFFEIVGHMDFDFYFHRHFFVRGGFRFDFYNSIYRNHSIGVGGHLNLSRQRPFYVKFIAQFDNLRYARRIDQAKNDYGDFRFDGKKYTADRVNIYYGSRTFNLKLTGELSIELDPNREFFVSASYLLPFARRQDVWFWERREIFRRKRKVPASEDRLLITQDGEVFDGAIYPDQSFLITVGFLFK